MSTETTTVESKELEQMREMLRRIRADRQRKRDIELLEALVKMVTAPKK